MATRAEFAPIRFDRNSGKGPVTASTLADMAADRFALAHASKSRVHAFGLAWDDTTGKNTGQYTRFSGQGG